MKKDEQLSEQTLAYFKTKFHQVTKVLVWMMVYLFFGRLYVYFFVQENYPIHQVLRPIVLIIFYAGLYNIPVKNTKTYNTVVLITVTISFILSVESVFAGEGYDVLLHVLAISEFVSYLFSFEMSNSNTSIYVEILLQCYYWFRITKKYNLVSIPMLFQFLVTILCIVLRHWVRQGFLTMFIHKFNKTTILKNRWLKTIQNMPSGIIMYSLKKDKVIFKNETFGKIFE